MKVNNCLFFCLLLALLTMQGCSGVKVPSSMAPYEKMMTREEMYYAPVPDNPEVLSAIILPINFLWNLGDTARYPDYHLPNSTTWRFIILPTDATDTSEAERYYAIKYMAGRFPFLATFLPEGLKKFEGKSGFLLDNSGTRLMGANGQYVRVKNWKKIDPSKYKEIIIPISEMKTVEAFRDKPEDRANYGSLQNLVSAYKVDVDVRLGIVEKILNKKKKALGIPLKSKLTEDQSNELLQDEELQAQLWVLLFDNWDINFSVPMLSLEQMGLYIVASKVFHISSELFGDDLNRPGFMDNKEISSLDVAAMIKQWQGEYGLKNNEMRVLRKFAKYLLAKENERGVK